MRKMYGAPGIAALAVALGLGVAGCGGSSNSSSADTSDSSSSEAATAAAATASEPPAPDPDGTYQQSCDYLLGDFTSHTSSGFRFVADARLHNTGNVGTVDKVKATWFLAGGDKITRSKKVKVKPGKHKRVGFDVPVGQDEIDRIQALGYDAKQCKVKVTMVEMFGEPQED